MTEYIPSTSDWVREQVELYESTGERGNSGAQIQPHHRQSAR